MLAGLAETYKVVEYTLVQLPLCRSALPELLVVVVQALPMLTELLQTVLVNILDAEYLESVLVSSLPPIHLLYVVLSSPTYKTGMIYVPDQSQ